MSQASTEIIRISGHAGTVPGAGLNREFQVAKLVDTTTCIGCKACEVACLEWNGYTFSETTFNNSYQTMPETAWNYWNLIKFNEHEREDGSMMLLMRKDQCMHCEDPGCLAACPADAAIVQYANGIVDFQEANCIGCGYCMTGCPFNIPKFSPEARKVFQMHSVQRPRFGRARTGVHQGVPDGLPAFRDEVGNEGTGGDARGAAAHAVRIRGCGSLRSSGSGRNARDLRTARREESGVVWRIAEGSAHSVFGAFVEGTAEMAGKFGDGWRAGRAGVALLASWAEEGRADSAG